MLQLQSEVLQMKERSVATQSLLPSQVLTVIPSATPTHTHTFAHTCSLTEVVGSRRALSEVVSCADNLVILHKLYIPSTWLLGH